MWWCVLGANISESNQWWATGVRCMWNTCLLFVLWCWSQGTPLWSSGMNKDAIVQACPKFHQKLFLLALCLPYGHSCAIRGLLWPWVCVIKTHKLYKIQAVLHLAWVILTWTFLICDRTGNWQCEYAGFYVKCLRHEYCCVLPVDQKLLCFDHLWVFVITVLPLKAGWKGDFLALLHSAWEKALIWSRANVNV